MDTNKAMVELSFGRVPLDKDILRSITVGLDKVSSFIKDEYFDTYISHGGSKIKFVTGKKGAGKSHLLKLMSFDAMDSSFITVELDSRELLLSDLTNLYLAILKNLDLEKLISRSALNMVKSLGYDYTEASEKSFASWLGDRGELTFYSKSEIRLGLRKIYQENPNLDYNFAQIMSLLAASSLGTLKLDNETSDIVARWLKADKTLKLSELRSLGLAGYRINKFNARFLIRSLSELVHLAGYNGLFVSIDNAESMISTSSLNPVKYTKMRRDDGYEAIRELIDDIDTFRYFFLVFGFDRSLIDNEKNGIKSYQALWLRIQNEIVSKRVNLYTDLLNLDKINMSLYTEEAILEMSRRLSQLFTSYDISAVPMTDADAERLMKESRYGETSLPLLVNRFTLKLDKKEEN
jgi:hypothetical protein